MFRLPFELFLALRYLRPKRTSVSVITLISILGVMLGVAVLIVVIAVMSGFDREWRAKILGFNSHIEIARAEQNATIRDWRTVMSLVTNLPRVQAAAPSVLGKVLAEVKLPNGETLNDTPILRGIHAGLEPQVSLIPRSVVLGTNDLDGRGALIGKDLAVGLQLKVGDRFSVYSPANVRRIVDNAKAKKDEAILPDELEVRGIFDVGFADFNALFVITSLETAQDFYELGTQVHGLNVVLSDPFAAPAVQTQLRQILGPEFRVITWMERYSELFNTLVLEKNMIFFLLFFIVLVAAFGITSSLITFVVQKTREVGVLKALGATRGQVVWIFLSQGIVVGVIGVTTGLGLGLLALHYRNEFLHFLSHIAGRNLLTASIYKLYDLPADLMASDVGMICVGSLLICTLAGAAPAWTAGRLQPVEALRHE
ncbi:MAG: ABC transporter permease [Verrucomicrobia bacterium]|nr:ABC transporter permease [Verrucomicrobiota bacterium]MBI3870576.1 ABC transporter permease [Verrucomicrobiota bacterium]